MKFLTILLLIAVVVMATVEAFPKRKHGEITGGVHKEGGKTSWHVEGKQKVYENKHGSIHVSGGVNKQPGSKPQGQVGIGGSFHWG